MVRERFLMKTLAFLSDLANYCITMPTRRPSARVSFLIQKRIQLWKPQEKSLSSMLNPSLGRRHMDLATFARIQNLQTEDGIGKEDIDRNCEGHLGYVL